MRVLAVALACLAITACSKSTTADLSHDVKDKNDPDVRKAGDDAKKVGHDIAVSVKQDAATAKVEADKAGDKAKRTAADVKDDVKDDTKG